MKGLQILHEEIQKKYKYDRLKPIIRKQSYEVYQAVHKEMNISMTLKLYAGQSSMLKKYLKRLKELKIEGTIRIYDFYQSSDGLYIATEQVTFSNLKNALQKCRKLDESDAVFLIKFILVVHAQLLQSEFRWFGNETDIEFTDNGIKLSWNNGTPYTQENPFVQIFNNIYGKTIASQKILPFLKSKSIEDLILCCNKNSSEILLNPLIKKKQKPLKKKGRSWLGLRESKNDVVYYQQMIYLGVSKDHGLVRIKVYNKGRLDEQALSLNKSNPKFTKVVDYYDQGNKTIIVSEYSNDGSLLSYINRMKGNGTSLKSQQIQYIFYFLLNTLKQVQESPLKSICMLNIKNIYLQNLIPKIGDPVPLNNQIIQLLKQKSQVPDFYHAQFKRDPSTKEAFYDTYSLGILLYRLMYTEYPIFPNGKVHIPSAPIYTKKLKMILQNLLDDGGLLSSIQGLIQITPEVIKQVQLDSHEIVKAEVRKSSQDLTFIFQDVDQNQIEDFTPQINNSNILITNEKQKTSHFKEAIYYDEDISCCTLCCMQLKGRKKFKNLIYNTLQKSPYSKYRIFIKTMLILFLYFFLFYFFFIKNSSILISNLNNLQRLSVNIPTGNVQITVSDTTNFQKIYTSLPSGVATLNDLGCFINRYNGGPDYTFAAQSISFIVYIAMGLLTMVLIMLIKIFQIVKLDIIRTVFNMSNLLGNFNMSNYIIIHLLIASLISNHFIVFNQIFYTSLPLCLGMGYQYGSADTYYRSNDEFIVIFVISLLMHFVFIILSIIMLAKNQEIMYSKLFNPIIYFVPFIATYFIIFRVGISQQYFYPSLTSGISTYAKYFIQKDFVGILGTLPEIFFFLQYILEWIIDYFFWIPFKNKGVEAVSQISTAKIAM